LVQFVCAVSYEFACRQLYAPCSMLLYSPRQTTGSKNIIRIQGGFDPVHDLPFRPWRTENIIAFPEFVRRLDQQAMTVMLVDFSA
jgi:hypothetical protein